MFLELMSSSKDAQPSAHTNAHAKSIRINYLKYRIAIKKIHP